MSKCTKNLPKISLPSQRFRIFSLHFLRVFVLFPFFTSKWNDNYFPFLRCSIIGECVCVLSEWGGENVSLTCDFSFSPCALRERRSPSLCLSNETKNRLSSCVLLILWMRCFLSLKKIFLRYSIFSANLCVSNANSFKSIRKTRN